MRPDPHAMTRAVEKLARTDEAVRELITDQNGRAAAMAGAEFSALSDDRYTFSLPALGVVFEIDRLRRERHELMGELRVRCDLPGAKTYDGTLSIADFNLSSARARSERAKMLAERAETGKEIDWTALLEEFCQRVLKADRTGKPAVDLRSLPAPAPDDDFQVEGLQLLRRHPVILFGDGGAAKSYFGLYLAGRLAERGMKVALFDWELAGEDHRDRLERLFWDGMPHVLYARCERPLVYEVDRLKRIVKEHGAEYLIYDSVAFACDGPPEAAEVAGCYFRAVRQIGGGSLHIAHVSKGENADQKPFGSAFWHNGARSTWYAQVENNSAAEGEPLNLGLFNRKANLGRLRTPLGFTITFDEERTTFRKSDVTNTPELAKRLTVTQKMQHLLRSGALTVTQIAEELDIEVNTVTQTVNRYVKKGRVFIVLSGKDTGRKIGLLQRDTVS